MTACVNRSRIASLSPGGERQPGTIHRRPVAAVNFSAMPLPRVSLPGQREWRAPSGGIHRTDSWLTVTRAATRGSKERPWRGKSIASLFWAQA
jgi:hypothetical protein